MKKNSISKVLAALTFFLLVLSCSKDEELQPTEIILSASSTSLIADGKDAVTFQVAVLDGNANRIPDADYEIYVNGDLLNSQSFKTDQGGEYKVVARISGIESNEVVLEAIILEDLAASIELASSKNAFIADGEDSVSFEVNVFDEEKNLLKGVSYQIFVNGEILESTEFSTTSEGEYTVVVRIENIESNPITLTATTPEGLVASIILETSTELIIADGISQADLIVRPLDENGEEVPNVDFQLFSQGSPYDWADFTTNQAGTYTIFARVNEITSNEIHISARENKTYAPLNIPVIFHIGHFGESVGSGNNVDAALIEKLLEGLNRGFANQYGSDNPNAVATEISFRLATLDPDNNTLAEPGIHRLDISGYDVGSSAFKRRSRIMPVPFLTNCSEASAEATIATTAQGDIPNDQHLGWDESYEMGRQNIWPRKEYLNVFVIPIQKNLNLGGFAYLPFVTEDNGLEGFSVYPEETNISIGKNEGCVIDTSIALYSYPSTLIHEVGHNLGLYHNFSEDNCITSDYCGDTFTYNLGYEIGHPSRNCPGNKVDNVQDNYMDYSGTYNTFTYDQRERMRTVFEFGYFYRELKNSNK